MKRTDTPSLNARSPIYETPAAGYTLFATPIGTCGIAWRDGSVVGVGLPEADDEDVASKMRERSGEHPARRVPEFIATAISEIRRLLKGEAADLSKIAVSMDGLPPFHQRVYELTRTIAPGTTLTYGEVADRVGSPGGARAVGQALGRNPLAIIVPCHRVLAAGNKPGGFTAAGGITTKLAMLAIERRGRERVMNGVDARLL